MSFKKNAIGYSVWMIFIMCNCIVFSFLGMLCARNFSMSLPVAAALLVAAFFGLLFLIYLLTGFISRNLSFSEIAFAHGKNALIVEGLTAVFVLAAGIVIRIYFLPVAGESAAYFDVAKVSAESTGFLVPVQGSVYYYLCLLHGLFYLFGNHWIAGIWLQIVLQVLGSVVLYFAIRKLAGVFSAVAVLGYLMFVPSSVMAGLTYSPQMLYFVLWAAALLFVALYLNCSTKAEEKESRLYAVGMWIAVVLLGLFLGFVIYTDISGCTLLIPFILMPMVKRTNGKTGIWVGRMFYGLLMTAGGFIGCFFLDALISGSTFMRVMNAWLVTFSMDVPNLVTLLQNSTLEVIILLIFMAFNIFSFYRQKDKDTMTHWFLMTLLLAVLYVLGITTTSMNGRFLLLLMMCIVAAVSVRNLFAVRETEEASEEETIQIIELDSGEKPRFIENPLPLPKKHVKKVMDYGFVPEEAQMKYDVEVADSDDFDV